MTGKQLSERELSEMGLARLQEAYPLDSRRRRIPMTIVRDHVWTIGAVFALNGLDELEPMEAGALDLDEIQVAFDPEGPVCVVCGGTPTTVGEFGCQVFETEFGAVYSASSIRAPEWSNDAEPWGGESRSVVD